MAARAPPDGRACFISPPMRISSAASSGGSATRTRVSIASAGRPASLSPSPTLGVGCSGSRCTWQSAFAGIILDRVGGRAQGLQRRDQRVGFGGGDPQAVAAGEADNLGDVLRAGGQRDRGGMLVHGQVPGPAGVVPASVAGGADRGRGSHNGGHRKFLGSVRAGLPARPRRYGPQARGKSAARTDICRAGRARGGPVSVELLRPGRQPPGQLGPAAHAQLAVDRRDVRLDGPHADE